MDLVLPVSNESWTEETRRAPPFAYSTPTGLAQAAERAAASPEPPFPVESPRSPVFAARLRVHLGVPVQVGAGVGDRALSRRRQGRRRLVEGQIGRESRERAAARGEHG